MTPRIEKAKLIATVAHGARGQVRADGVTPYISHPARVVELVYGWQNVPGVQGVLLRSYHDAEIAMEAGWLHDVLEDTKLTRADLSLLGVREATLNVVDLLTKKNGNEPATPEYYQGIAGDDIALVVKCADRCANLEDALREIGATRSLRRWRRYVEKTYRDVLPMYKSVPFLRDMLELRLREIESTGVMEIA